MNIPDKCKVDHLFLLIGENPLPNYVAARTLLNDGGTVYLVFPSYEHIIRRKDLLEGVDGLNRFNIKCQPIDLGKHESNAQEIYGRIQTYVKEYAQEGNVGLNYTGGTKAMAVHAYRAIQKLKPNAYFSYLDPRQLKMWINEGDQKPVAYEVPLQISLEELFSLHGTYLLTNYPPYDKPFAPDLSEEILKLHESDSNEKDWKKWCNKFPALNSEIDLQKLSPQIRQGISQYFDCSGEKAQAKSQINQGHNFDEFKKKDSGKFDWNEFKKWLEGTWLESYTLKMLQEIADNIGINPQDCMRSFNVVNDKNKINTTNKEEDAKFEFDVAFIKGYQLFAFSCTAKSKKSDCKEKLFEAYLRARELGGDEARVALICCFDEPEEIEEEMARFGIRNLKIKVFGREHLANLAEEIADWVERVEQEANQE